MLSVASVSAASFGVRLQADSANNRETKIILVVVMIFFMLQKYKKMRCHWH